MLITAFLTFFDSKGHLELHNNEFLKTWDELQTDPETHRLTEKWTNWSAHKRENFTKPTLSVVNVAPPDAEYL